MQITIRPAETKDLPGILEIMNHNILHSTAVYDYVPKSLDEIQGWFNERQQDGFKLIAAEYNGSVAGYAGYGIFKPKAGYRFTVEHSVYVSEEFHGKGIGKLLMAELIAIAKKEGIHSMIGVIDADNAASIAFHKQFGFTETGFLKQAGFKFGRWLDVTFMQLLFD
ncbi:N-acetyltransferase family protein [Flavobacterium sp. DG1-102-2]|uniref:GNAT family N-acetyltransferase n=1 Tax=Flavobacterium sp. DG1-102-2 TaxID=3081663 RepID=UPI002949E969|nr:N-acetyltransferase family protein [Flavobacterium sp. DG1-102-2]MDV6169709.1 N-acetyltransferase family protein [Flavobacterium sp. DG1-102-2]